MTEQWQELKETIIEMRDNDGTGTQKEVCQFLVNLMNVLEKQMSNSENMTADSIRRIAMQVTADKQAIAPVDDHLLGFDNGVLALAEALIDSLDELQKKRGET